MKNSKRHSMTIAAAILLQAATPAQAMIRALEQTSMEPALEQCRAALRSRYANPEQHRIYRRPAASVRSDSITFWINSSASLEGQQVALKSRCVTDSSGQMVSLKVASGQWN